MRNIRSRQNQTSTYCGGRTYNTRMNCNRVYVITFVFRLPAVLEVYGKPVDACMSHLLEVVESPDNNVELYVNGGVW